MRFDKEVKKNLVFIGVGCGVCTVLTILAAALLGQFNAPVLIGCVVGGLLAFGNYYFLSVGIMMALASGDEKQAKRKMRTSRIVRTVVQLGVIAFAILFPHRIHWLPVILSTFFPRILIGVKGYWDFMRHRNDPIPVSDTPAEPDDGDEENADGFEKFVSHFSKGNIPGENAGEDKK